MLLIKESYASLCVLPIAAIYDYILIYSLSQMSTSGRQPSVRTNHLALSILPLFFSTFSPLARSERELQC